MLYHIVASLCSVQSALSYEEEEVQLSALLHELLSLHTNIQHLHSRVTKQQVHLYEKGSALSVYIRID